MAGIQDLAQYGRGNDSMIAHVTPGEMMVPPEMMARHPDLQRKLYQAYIDEGMDPRRFKVGSGITSLNPTTGQPEYGFFKSLLKAAAPVVGYMLGGAGGAAIGGGLAGYMDGGGFKGALGGAALGYIGGSLAGGGAFGDTVKGAAGGGIGGWSPFGAEKVQGWGANKWGTDLVKNSIDKAGGSTFSTIGKGLAIGAMATPLLADIDSEPLADPSEDASATEKGEPFDLDIPSSSSFVPRHQITSDTAGYSNNNGAYATYPYPNYKDMELPNIEIPDFDFDNLSLAEMRELYNPKPVYFKHGGIINSGTTGTADDVPIMASKGEFVMTADAVRNAGKGDPRLGAKKLYNLMYSLEGAR